MFLRTMYVNILLYPLIWGALTFLCFSMINQKKHLVFIQALHEMGFYKMIQNFLDEVHVLKNPLS
jgi:hypothetical protein